VRVVLGGWGADAAVGGRPAVRRVGDCYRGRGRLLPGVVLGGVFLREEPTVARPPNSPTRIEIIE